MIAPRQSQYSKIESQTNETNLSRPLSFDSLSRLNPVPAEPASGFGRHYKAHHAPPTPLPPPCALICARPRSPALAWSRPDRATLQPRRSQVGRLAILPLALVGDGAAGVGVLAVALALARHERALVDGAARVGILGLALLLALDELALVYGAVGEDELVRLGLGVGVT